MNYRKAQCACGQLALTVQEDPLRILTCHCDYCQRRTGAPFQVSCWYEKDKVEIAGEYKVFAESANSVGVDYRFCPTCGSTVFWSFDNVAEFPFKNFFGIAVGAFADPNFPKPELELHVGHRCSWIPEFEGLPQCEGFPPPELATKGISL